jgi:hypothetical protein
MAHQAITSTISTCLSINPCLGLQHELSDKLLVIFDGNTHGIDTNGDGVPDACGTPAEAPLHLEPGSVPARYVQWAISFAMSKGIPAHKLSSEAIVGSFFLESQPPAGLALTRPTIIFGPRLLWRSRFSTI